MCANINSARIRNRATGDQGLHLAAIVIIAGTIRLVDTVTTPMLLKTVNANRINPMRLITHHFKLDKIVEAYDTFDRATETKALKVVITA